LAVALLSCDSDSGAGGESCEPLSCAEAGAACGDLDDGCEGTLECGECAEGLICGLYSPNRCGSELCVPLTCEAAVAACGEIDDGCDGVWDCGECAEGLTCGYDTPNQCGGERCTPLTCSGLNMQCGSVDDGCEGTLECGECGTETCMWAGTASYCVDPGTGSTGGTSVHTQAQDHTSMLLFDPAVDQLNVSYHSFRIPSIVRTTTGTLIAFAEGRQCSEADYGNINLVYKRSGDNGVTWGALREVVGAGAGTWGNPTAVVDEDSGRIWLFLSWNAEDKSQNAGTNPCTGEPTTTVGVGDRPVMLTYSDDDGLTWASPVDMTATLQPVGTAWDAMGPGVGIQTREGPHPGRLIIPAIGRNIYSDDGGLTWSYELIPDGTSEGTIVELSDGRLLRNDRAVSSVWQTASRRWLSRGSIEGGFETFWPHDTLLDPRVEGSSLVYTSSPHRIMFLNPSSTVQRCKMRVWLSYDNGGTWPISRQLHDDLTATETCDLLLGGYSSMTKTADFHVGALVERVEEGAGDHRGIEFHRFNLSWVVDGTPEP